MAIEYDIVSEIDRIQTKIDNGTASDKDMSEIDDLKTILPVIVIELKTKISPPIVAQAMATIASRTFDWIGRSDEDFNPGNELYSLIVLLRSEKKYGHR